MYTHIYIDVYIFINLHIYIHSHTPMPSYVSSSPAARVLVANGRRRVAGEVSFVALVLRLVLTPQDNPLFFPKLPVPKTYTRWDSVLGEGVCIWTLRSLICKQMHMCLSHTCVCLIHVSVSYMCQSHRCVSLMCTCVCLIHVSVSYMCLSHTCVSLIDVSVSAHVSISSAQHLTAPFAGISREHGQQAT